MTPTPDLMTSHLIPGIDIPTLEGVLAEVADGPARLVDAVALGASSRPTPWRIDVDVAGRRDVYLLRFGQSVSRTEVVALRAMSDHPLPTPRVLLWDESDTPLGTPVFVSEFVDGSSLLPPMIAGDAWAIDLYVDTACKLQAISAGDLPTEFLEVLGAAESARDVIDAAYRRFSEPTPLHKTAYRRLIDTQPLLPAIAFSNGDLWPDNLLVKDQHLVGVIDWQHAGWSDPIFEFLLPFFLVPELRDRGIEQRYCERKGYSPALLHWYHGVEFFDSLAWVLKIGEPYEMHTEDSLTADLASWLQD
jgi:aminoglycoside phosphotransferase (APT) family kinase protein